MDIRKLQRAIVDGLEDVKAQNIVVFNTEHLSPLFERVIIASGTSNRQTKALAASVVDAVKTQGLAMPRTEGEASGEWIIVDCGAAVAHIMQPMIRDYYRLEEIWGGKLVRMKLGDGKTRLATASEDASEGDDAPAPARKAAGKSAVKGTRSSAGTSAGKGAGKNAGSNAAPAKKASTRKATAKRPAGPQAPSRGTPPPRKAPARKAAAPARKSSGRNPGKAAAVKRSAPRG